MKWLELKKNQADCPVCKSAISKDNLIPIYNKDQNNSNTNRFDIPHRPKGERTEKTNEVTIYLLNIRIIMEISITMEVVLILWVRLGFSHLWE